MEEFANTVTDTKLQRLLHAALGGRGSFRRFKDVLGDFPAWRDRWFEFRDAKMREWVLEWLEDNDLAPARDKDQEPDTKEP